MSNITKELNNKGFEFVSLQLSVPNEGIKIIILIIKIPINILLNLLMCLLFK